MSEKMKTPEQWLADHKWCQRCESPNIGSFTVYGIEAIQADAIAAERARLEKLGGINLAQFEHVSQEYIRQGKELAEAKEASALIETMQKNRWHVEFNDRAGYWTVQEQHQVVGCISHGPTILEALKAASNQSAA